MSLLQRAILPRTYVYSTMCIILGATFNISKPKQISYRHTGTMEEAVPEKGRSDVTWQVSNGIRLQTTLNKNLENTWKATNSFRFSDGKPTQCVTIPLEYRTSQKDSVSTTSRQGSVEHAPPKSTISSAKVTPNKFGKRAGKMVPTLIYSHSITLTSCWPSCIRILCGGGNRRKSRKSRSMYSS